MTEPTIKPGHAYQVLPDMPPEQYEALKADIARRGVLTPIEIDEGGNILDGHHRYRAWSELAKNEPPPVIVRAGLNEDEKRLHARKANVLRRHLSREEVRRVIKEQLKETPFWSSRSIATALGVDDKTVGAVRKELVATAEIPQLDKRTGADGKKRIARPKRHIKERGGDRPESYGRGDPVLARQMAAAFGGTAGARGLPDELKLAFFEAGIPSDTVIVMQAPAQAPMSEGEEREWEAFARFLAEKYGFDPEGADDHINWLIRQGFSRAEWLGAEGEQYRNRYGMRQPSPGIAAAWADFTKTAPSPA